MKQNRLNIGSPINLLVATREVVMQKSSLVVTLILGLCFSISNAATPNIRVWGDYVASSGGQTNVPQTLTNAVAISAGGNQGGLLNLALQPSGSVVSWGGDFHGQTNVPSGLSHVIAIAAGMDHSIALLSDGTVKCWGSSLCPASLTNAPPELTNVVAIAAGDRFCLALRVDGTVTEWPSNEVPAGLSDVVAVAAGISHSLALKSDGTVVGWGYDWYGVTDIPVEATNIVAVAAGYRHNLLLRSDGSILAWGANFSGQTNVPPALTNAIAIAAGMDASLALRRDGTVIAWGDNGLQQTNVPVGLSNVVAISMGFAQGVALLGDGTPLTQVPVHPMLTSEGIFGVSIPTQCGRVYRLEYKDALSEINWTPLSLVAGTSKTVILTDPSAINAQRFYRVRQW